MEHNILFTDLCTRLPYKPMVCVHNVDGKHDEELSLNHLELLSIGNGVIVKPYLRSMSSMTDEESVEINSMGFAYWTTMINNDLRPRGPMSLLDAIITHHKMVKLIDWLIAHHFDYRGLIGKRLALEAPEGMYNI